MFDNPVVRNPPDFLRLGGVPGRSPPPGWAGGCRLVLRNTHFNPLPIPHSPGRGWRYLDRVFRRMRRVRFLTRNWMDCSVRLKRWASSWIHPSIRITPLILFPDLLY